MNNLAASIEMLRNIVIDPEFESVCPALTEDEFAQLEQNILSDGEVTSPIIVWNNKLIDGHHRRQILLKHPGLAFQIKEIAFSNRYEAIAWICKNQAGRRNLTPEQLTYLVGMRYAAEKHSKGSSDGFRGNQYVDLVIPQNEELPNSNTTSERLAKEYGISRASVERAAQFARGVDAAEAACPGVKQELLSGSFKPTKAEVSALARLPAEEIPKKLSEYRKAQEERAEKRRLVREEKRRQAEETIEAEKCFSSIGELSANMVEPKRRNSVSNVVENIRCLARDLQDFCEGNIDEFPELLGKDKILLLQAVNDLTEYLNELKRR